MSRFTQYMQGYDELDTLERPLVGNEDVHDGEHDNDGREEPTAGEEHGGQQRVSDMQQARAESRAAMVPSQEEELQEISVLSKDAAEILWEMVALGENGTDLDDMKSRAEQLRAQLRGLLNDYSGGNEQLMCGALDAFDSLNAALEDQTNVPSQEPASKEEVSTEPVQQEAPVQVEKRDDPPPLINFD